MTTNSETTTFPHGSREIYVDCPECLRRIRVMVRWELTEDMRGVFTQTMNVPLTIDCHCGRPFKIDVATRCDGRITVAVTGANR